MKLKKLIFGSLMMGIATFALASCDKSITLITH